MEFSIEKIKYKVETKEVWTSHSFDITEYTRLDKSLKIYKHYLFETRLEAMSYGINEIGKAINMLENMLVQAKETLDHYL